MEISSIIFWLVVTAAIFYIVSIYNQLVTLRNRYQNGFAQIEVQFRGQFT